MKRALKGQITLFLSLLITIFISLTATLLYSSIIAGKKAMAENAADLAINSVFAEYNKKLLEEYDLFYIDMNELGGGFSKDVIANECYKMANEHLSVKNNLADFFRYRSLIQPNLDSVACTKYALATDDNCKVYKQQAIDYIKMAFPTIILDNLIELTKDAEYGANSGYEEALNKLPLSILDLKKNNEKALPDKSVALNKSNFSVSKRNYFSQINKNDVSPDLIAYLRAMKNNNIFAYVFKSKPSVKVIDNNKLFSKRNDACKGDGLPNYKKDNFFHEKLLFNEYLLEHFGNVAKPKENRPLDYEIEYIICGKDSDMANLKGVAYRLIAIREGANYTHIISSPSKTAEATALAGTIASVMLMPKLTKAIAQVVMMVWAFGESVLDVRDLFSGHRVPMIKTDKDFKLELSNIMNYISQKYEPCDNPAALDYKSYLRIILYLSMDKYNTSRSLDMIEANMRSDDEHQGFRIDGCVEWAECDVLFDIDKKTKLTKRFGYIQ